MGCGSSSSDQVADTSSTPHKRKEEWSQYEMDALNAHNNYRSKHLAAPLKLNKKLCQMAQNYANTLAKKKAFDHSKPKDRVYNGTSCGENLASSSTTADSLQYEGNEAVDSWYSEIRDYDYNNPENLGGMPTGHFTQVIWADSEELGQAYATYKKDNWLTCVAVANYHPAGNCMGEFGSKVKPLR